VEEISLPAAASFLAKAGKLGKLGLPAVASLRDCWQLPRAGKTRCTCLGTLRSVELTTWSTFALSPFFNLSVDGPDLPLTTVLRIVVSQPYLSRLFTPIQRRTLRLGQLPQPG